MIERNVWGGSSIIVWGGIGLNVKLGPVIFQNLGPGRDGNILDCWQLIDGEPYQHLLVADVFQQSVVQFQ
jgi:hypothetical protein